MTPCGDHTQLSSGLPGTLRYGLPPASICHSPREKFMRHDSPGCGRGERRPGEGDRHRPAAVAIARVVQGAVDYDGRAQARYFPTVIGLAAFAVGLGQEQIPSGIERVDLELEVVAPIARRIEEDLEIVVAEDHRIVCRQRGPHVRLD